MKLLLNSKSILDCNEFEEALHNDEIEYINQIVQSIENYDCVVVFKYYDIAHKKKKHMYSQCKLHEFLSQIEFVDYKNGIDLAITDNDLLTIIAFGQGYERDGINYLIERHIFIMPMADNNEFIDISPKLKNKVQKIDYTMIN